MGEGKQHVREKEAAYPFEHEAFLQGRKTIKAGKIYDISRCAKDIVSAIISQVLQ